MITLSVCIYELPVTMQLENIERRYEGALILFYYGFVCFLLLCFNVLKFNLMS
jgi:hypothetical protein